MMLLKIFLDTEVKISYNTTMKNQIAVKMSPEGLEVANTYLQLGSVSEVCTALALDENTVSEYLNKREIKQYIDQIYDAETVYTAQDYTPEELDNFISGMTEDQFSRIKTFFDTIPKLKHTVEFTCVDCKFKDSVEVEGLQSFFM